MTKKYPRLFYFMNDLAKIVILPSYPIGVSSSRYIDEAMEMDYLSPESGLGPSEQLYTARGVQGAGILQSDAEGLNVDPSNYNSTYIMWDDNPETFGTHYYQKRALWTVKSNPDFAPEDTVGAM